MPRKVYPLPEAIDAGKWDVHEGPPHINFDKDYLSVPLDDDPAARFLRAHEQAHLRWTPGKEAPGMTEAQDLGWATVQAVEDNRMHALLAAAGVDLGAGGMKVAERKALVDSLLKVNCFRDVTLCAVAAYGTGDYPELAAAVCAGPHKSALQLAAEVRWRLATGGVCDFKNALAVARWLEGIIGKDGPGMKQPAPGYGLPAGIPHPLVKMYGGPSIDTADMPTVFPGVEGTGGAPLPPIPGLVPWGTMTIDQPELPLPSCPRKAGFRAEDTGSYLRGPHRLLTDGRVFAIKRRHKGGSVLVDYSGSMALKESDVERILANAPASVIAVYSGDRATGVLKILARDGRRVTGDHVKRPAGGANVIDGPALDWLARQNEPRFWMSDGMVTGIGDASGTGNTAYANQVCQQSRVTRVRTAAELFVALRRAKAR